MHELVPTIVVTDEGGRRVNQWIVEQATILRVKHSLVAQAKQGLRSARIA